MMTGWREEGRRAGVEFGTLIERNNCRSVSIVEHSLVILTINTTRHREAPWTSSTVVGIHHGPRLVRQTAQYRINRLVLGISTVNYLPSETEFSENPSNYLNTQSQHFFFQFSEVEWAKIIIMYSNKKKTVKKSRYNGVNVIKSSKSNTITCHTGSRGTAPLFLWPWL
jgi:hypothetical protein